MLVVDGQLERRGGTQNDDPWTATSLRGCPIACSALEAAGAHPELLAAAARVYSGWLAALTAGLVAEGHPEGSAHRTALAALSVVEGGLLLAQTLRGTDPIDAAGAAVARLLQGD